MFQGKLNNETTNFYCWNQLTNKTREPYRNIKNNTTIHFTNNLVCKDS